jgi:hypothetical protein
MEILQLLEKYDDPKRYIVRELFIDLSKDYYPAQRHIINKVNRLNRSPYIMYAHIIPTWNNILAFINHLGSPTGWLFQEFFAGSGPVNGGELYGDFYGLKIQVNRLPDYIDFCNTFLFNEIDYGIYKPLTLEDFSYITHRIN